MFKPRLVTFDHDYPQYHVSWHNCYCNLTCSYIIRSLQVFTQNFPTIGMPSEMTNPAYLQFNSAQQLVSCCGGLINNMGITTPEIGLRRNINAPTSASLPEIFLDTSVFTVCFCPLKYCLFKFSNDWLVFYDWSKLMCIAAYPTLLNLGRWFSKSS
jgi:hypothetical protein